MFNLHVSNKKIVYDIIHDQDKQRIFEMGVGGGIMCFVCWIFCFVFWVCVYLKTHKKKIKYELIDDDKVADDSDDGLVEV